jgi:eukaryotic-like serine/threonine-protein kinase
MTDDRRQRLKKLFAEAVALPAGERTRFVAAASGADAALGRELESLLASYERADGFLERPPEISPLHAYGIPLDVRAPTLPTGRKLGPYQILEPLGAGGMGEVYRARDVRLDRIVALKVLHRTAAGDAGLRGRFEHEARAISKLAHPNICALFDIGEHEGVDFLVMEYLEGETLAARLAKGPLPFDAVVRHAIEISDALDRAHQQGVVHRDVKPSNIMLTESGARSAGLPQAKLLDFGVAKLQGRDAAASGAALLPAEPGALTGGGPLVGTIAYMSPEQLRGEAIDARSDLFSFGAVLYEMATGRRLFAGSDATAIRAAILEGEWQARRETADRVGEGLTRIIEKALHADRRDRYQHAADMRAELQQLDPAAGQQPGSRRWKLIGAAAALIVALTIAGALMAGVGRSRPVGHSAAVPSLSILPFTPLAPGGADDYVGVALADALATELHALDTVSVRRIGTGNRFTGPGADPIAAGRELGVDLVMDGAIQRQGDRLRVTVHLARVSDAVTLWSQHFDSAWNDVFRVQDQIAEQVTHALAATLTGDERRRLNRRRTGSLDAYEAYLKGRYFWNERNVQALHRALDYFEQAIAKDPNYASAYAGIADTYAMLGSMPYADLSESDAGPKAKAAATKALELDETLAEAHVSLAFITYAFEWDWARGEAEFKRAIELDPEYATAHYWYALYLNQVGRTDEALAQAQRSVDLEPLSLVGTYSVGLAHYFARDFDAARRYADKTLEISPQFLLGRRLRGMVDIAMGRNADAIVGLRALNQAQAESSLSAGLLAYAYGRAGDRASAHAVLDPLVTRSQERFVSPANIALGYVGTDEVDTAIRFLELAYAQRSQALTFLKNDPLYDRIRSDPRVVDLIARVDFPPSPARQRPAGAAPPVNSR